MRFDLFVLNENRVSRSERVEIYRDEKYIVVAPLTERASCKYGADTNWCTSALSSGAFSSMAGVINTQSNPKLVYVIRIGYQMSEKNTLQSEEFYYLFKKFENEDFDDESEEEIEKLRDRYYDMVADEDSLDLSKIAIEYNPQHSSYNIWSANNINISDSPWYYGIDNLPIDDNVITAIKNFCMENQKN